jgi:hypothetical protein
MSTLTEPQPERPSSDQGVVWYLDKVKELIPAEVSAAFLAINSAIPIDDRNNKWLYGFFVALLLLCALYVKLVKNASYVRFVFITLIVFPVWAMNIAVARSDFLSNNTWLPASVLFIVTATSPLVAFYDSRKAEK